MQEQEPSLTSPAPGGAQETPAAAEPGPAAESETMPSQQEIIRQLELQAQEHYDAWLRAKAEADNIRKRAQADIANAHKYALETFAAELLPVRDALEAALAADNTTIDALRQGVELTLKQIDGAFEKAAIKEINPVGERFDPHRHQAMTTVESDKAANTVVHVLQKGYLLHDRVLRPALVTVSKAPQ
ncbi:MAG TPA: nucleotide exchange factor GrpE [Burkholderiales bacterium]|nr:nucleotide exchange factor GrpE [Burkholderiales bacterium]